MHGAISIIARVARVKQSISTGDLSRFFRNDGAICRARFNRLLVCFIFCTLVLSIGCAAQDSLNTSADTTSVIIGDVLIIGNKTTKDFIILRELALHRGDTLPETEFEHKRKRSENNIYNTSLFNSVQITSLKTDAGPTNLYIIVKERWYIFPLPIFEIIERNFNAWWRTKDLERIVYGGVLYWYNFRGRAETINLAVRTGYTQSIGFSYSIPYINRKQTAGLSFGFSYLRNRQVPYQTFNNTLFYYKDSRFIRTYNAVAAQYSYRQGLYRKHYFTAEHVFTSVSDTVSRLNPEFFGKGKSTEQYFSLRYLFKHDRRDIVAYPLKGFEYDVEVVKNGLPFTHDDINYAFLYFNYRKYFSLTNRLYFAAGIKGKISDGNFQPYFNTRGLGYGNDYLRGYEYYVIDGQHFGLVRSNLKFALLPKYELHIPFIPEKFATIPIRFYLNTFGDAGYVVDDQFTRNNAQANSWQFGYGAGIDFVTYYDIVVRLEYSINKFRESGFFLHFSAPI